jgi:hypothetical protein
MNLREQILRLEKLNSDENSGVQKVQNWNNCGIPQNFKQISQPRGHGGVGVEIFMSIVIYFALGMLVVLLMRSLTVSRLAVGVPALPR